MNKQQLLTEYMRSVGNEDALFCIREMRKYPNLKPCYAPIVRYLSTVRQEAEL